MKKCSIRQFAYSAAIASSVILSFSSSPGHAASSWLSTMTNGPNGKITMADSVALTAAASSSDSVFNITVSLEENPTGDDLYPDDPGASDDDQNAFEAKLEEFADAVFQMTNGKHKIGKVTVFRNGDQSSNSDVQWEQNCASNAGPRAHPSGFGVAGRHIYFCTTWPGSSSMDTPKGAGFTLAHEWAHYAYGVYDEYVGNCTTGCRDSQPQSTDTPSSPSIMNNQWRARTAGFEDWLEFSTENVEPYLTTPSGDDKNAHARVFSEDGWTTLTRDTASDPRVSYLPTRTHYTNLVAPTAADWTVNDDESTARSELDIIWAGDQVVELMIDTSGSMTGTPISNARTAASLLVGLLEPGASAVGVGRFSSSASQSFTITDIPDPDTGVRASAQAAITGFGASGGTDIEGAAITALNEVLAFQGGTRPSVVYLLTDGQSSVNVANVVNQYTAARVPLITFGFGPNVDAALLQNLANGTGGQYFFSPTSLAQIQQAFLAANAAFSSSSVVDSASSVTAASATDVRTVELDSSLAIASINVTYALAETDISLRLLDSSGNDTAQAFTCSSAAEVSCEAQVDVQALGTGSYGIEIVNNSSADKEVATLVSATPSIYNSYDIAVQADNISYPSGLSLRAVVSKGAPLRDLDVTARITAPDGSQFDVSLLDNGTDADLVAEDGTYSVDVPYDSNGTYTAVVTASNAAATAKTTSEGLAVSVKEDGSPADGGSVNITENFTRVGVINMAVNNYQSDDHTDDPTAPTACTAVADDNLDTVGRIDSAGDVDCFFFTPNSLSSDLVVRATDLRSNMRPVVRVFDSTGATELLSVDLASSSNAQSGVIGTIPSSTLNALGHVVTVEHTNSAASSGAYALSVGDPIASDNTTTAPPPPPATAKCNGLTATIVGTSGDDTLYGTSGDDVIAGLGGNDVIYGRDGDDTICGSAGDDDLFGGKGDDTLVGGAGDDILRGSYGDDLLKGGPGMDRLAGSYNDDKIYGGGGNDRLYGNAGHDYLLGGAGDDVIIGSWGADTIIGGAGSDRIRGDSNNDTIKAGPGNDSVDGGSGHDYIYGQNGDDSLQGSHGYDAINGGAGTDRCVADTPTTAFIGLSELDAVLLEDADLFDDGSDDKPKEDLPIPEALHPIEESAKSCEIKIGY